MNTDKITHELIESYLQGKLEDFEKNQLEERLRSDMDLVAQLEAHKIANEIIIGNRLAQVKNLMDIDFYDGNVSKKINKKWWGAGLLIITCFAGLWIFSRGRNGEIHEKHINTTTLQKQTNIFPTDQELKIPSPIKPKTTVKNTKIIEGLSLQEANEDPIIEDIETIKKGVDEVPFIEQIADKKELNVPHKLDCMEGNITGDLHAEPTCKGEHNGRISLISHSVKGGQPPYQYKLIDTRKDTLGQADGQFANLSAGVYTFIIEDINGCYGTLKAVELIEKICNKNPAHSFNPSIGEVFVFPVRKEEEATILIFDKAGRPILRRQIHPGESESWNGTDTYGQDLASGLYIYMVEYKSGHKESGEVIVY